MVYGKAGVGNSYSLCNKFSDGGLGQHKNWGATPSAGEGKMFSGIFWVEGSNDSYASLNALQVNEARMKDLVRSNFDKERVRNLIIFGSN